MLQVAVRLLLCIQHSFRISFVLPPFKNNDMWAVDTKRMVAVMYAHISV